MKQIIEELVQALTLDEKIGMIHGNGLFQTKGVERLGIPPLKMSDGPMGVRKEYENDCWKDVGNSEDYVTYLPSNGALAATWNRTLAYETGKVLGEEARGRGKDVILAPGINIKRSPLCGRNFEYMSEDPYLCGEMAVPLIQGVQTADVAACVKHFALNNQETNRFQVDVKVSDRALREIYFPAFEKAVKKAKSHSLMGAYNRYRGAFCCESKELLNRILREEWNYDGMVVSDWGAVHGTKESAESGLDIEMSVTSNFDEYYMAEPLKRAVENGEVSEELLNEKVCNILRMMFRLHMLGDEARKAGSYNTEEHRKSALETARESVILLKNEDKLLPLSKEKTKKVLVIGDNANRLHANGGGSAEIKALYEVSPLLGIKKLLGGNADVTYVQGYHSDDADKEKAIKMAAEFETVIFVGGQNHEQDMEEKDRLDMKLPYDQDQLLEEILKVNPNTIVVIVSGSLVEMPWADKVKALIWHWYAGMEGGTALAEVIFGEVNPSGRLPETFPINYMDCPAHCIGEYPGEASVDYKEGIFVGYRYYSTEHVSVQFPFGYGLSYTEFEMDKLEAVVKEPGDNPVVQVQLNVKNIGDFTGKEVVQIYIGKKNSNVTRPVRELKEFAKVELQPGETKKIEFVLEKEAFSYYDENKKKFIIEPGKYIISAGKSIENICTEVEVEL